MYVVFAFCVSFAVGSPSAVQRIYWTDGTDNAIRRATFDGDDSTTLISTGLVRPDGIAIDPVGLKMYWAEQGGRIQRADLDGTSIELLVNAGGTPRDVALDLPRQHLYWIEAIGGRIRRSDLNGGNIETVYDLVAAAGSGISIDSVGGKIYWVNASGVHRVNLDGTSPDLFFLADNGFTRELDLDLTNGHLYWANQQFQYIAKATIPDGVRINDAFILPCEPNDVAIDPTTQLLFWTGTSPVGIRRGSLDWTDLTTIIAQPGQRAIGHRNWSDAGFVKSGSNSFSVGGCRDRVPAIGRRNDDAPMPLCPSIQARVTDGPEPDSEGFCRLGSRQARIGARGVPLPRTVGCRVACPS